MSKLLAKILGNAGGGVLEKISNVADKFITTKEEKMDFEKSMKQILIDAEQKAQAEVTERWVADAKAGWLAANIRPLTLIFLTFVFVIMSFFDGNIRDFSISDGYKPIYQTLLLSVYGSYFVGRSIEKFKKSA